MRKLITFALAGGLLIGLLGPATAAAPKPVQIFEDVAGDADAAQGLGQSIPAGFDLLDGSIVRNGANLDFTVTHADMPPVGSMPEAARFLWNFTVNGKPFRLTVKSVDLGKPDVVGGQTSERVGRADVQGHFRIEGECTTDASLPLQRVNCPPVGYYTGAFDPASMSFTAEIPMKDIGAKPGSVIGIGQENICIICWVSQVAERSLNTTIIDYAGASKTYKVPR